MQSVTQQREGKHAASRLARQTLATETPRQGDAPRRLGDLRRSQPADVTLKNIVGVLTTKLELCARLPVCEFEAASDGDERCAASFHALAEAERSSCEEVIECLRAHLEQMVGSGT